MQNYDTYKRASIFIFACLLPASNSFAYINGRNIQNETLFYCPPTINCSSTVFESCKFPGEAKNWQINPKAPVKEGSYNLVQVNAPYHATNSLVASCLYDFGTLNPTKISLEAKMETNFEAFVDRGNKWIVLNGKAYCSISASSSKSCPLHIKSALLIHNIDINGIYAAVNGTFISKRTPGNSYVNIAIEDTISKCGSERICQLDLVSNNHDVYGSVSVDMDNKMKIVNVTSTHPLQVSVKRIDDFNAVEISKYHEQSK